MFCLTLRFAVSVFLISYQTYSLFASALTGVNGFAIARLLPYFLFTQLSRKRNALSGLAFLYVYGAIIPANIKPNSHRGFSSSQHRNQVFYEAQVDIVGLPLPHRPKRSAKLVNFFEIVS